MKKATAGFLALAASAVFAGGAQAQICAGFPTIDRQFSFEANLVTAEGVDLGDAYGVAASYNASGPLSFFGGLTVADGGAGGDDTDIYGAGLAFELPSVGASLGTGVSACPVASIAFTSNEFGDAYAIPVGFGVGTNLGAGTGLTVSPYIIPQVIFSQFNVDEDFEALLEDQSDTNFGLEGGALLGFGTFWLGGTVDYVFEEDSDPVFTIRAGIRL